MNKRAFFIATAAFILMMTSFNSCKKDTPVITITTQPESVSIMAGSITGSLTVAANVTEGATLSYQWYSNTSNSNAGGTEISGATAETFAIPTTLVEGTYYYFCEVRATDGATSVRSNVATVTVTSAQGNGTADNPYIIRTPAELDNVRNGRYAHYKLGNDIDLAGYLASGGAGFDKWGAEGWQPIGTATSTTAFFGTLDGANFKITGLWINRTSTDDVGLFGCIAGATVKNLGVEVATGGIKGKDNVGGVAGSVQGVGSIINCYAVGGAVTGNDYVGGVAGLILNISKINNSYTACNVSGNNNVGGVTGYIHSSSISNCYTTGGVSGNNYVGGVAGQIISGSSGSSISNCYAAGEVSCGTFNGGGIAGYFGGNQLINCVALNSGVNAGNGVGRVAGGLQSGTNNWARNDMTVTELGLPKTLEKGGDKKDGADCAPIPAASWWTPAAPNGPGWSSDIWIFTDGQLPKLK